MQFQFFSGCVKINEGKCPTKPRTILNITKHSCMTVTGPGSTTHEQLKIFKSELNSSLQKNTISFDI